MKALHEICSKTGAGSYIQVRDGRVSATDEHKLLSMRAVDVFGEGIIDEKEELYFRAEEWKTAKFHKAASFKREEKLFTAFDNKQRIIGRAIAITQEKFEEIACKKYFPISDFLKRQNEKAPAFSLGLNAKHLKQLTDAMDVEVVKLTWSKSYEFKVEALADETGMDAIIMGVVIGDSREAAEIYSEPTAEMQNGKDTEIAELKNKLSKCEAVLRETENKLAVAADAAYNQTDNADELNVLQQQLTEAKEKLYAAEIDAANSDAEADAMSNDLDILKSRFEELEKDKDNLREELDGFESYEDYRFSVSNEQERQIFIEFIDMLKGSTPMAVLGYLSYLKSFA